MKPWLKLSIETGPLIIFFIINGRGGLPEFRDLWLANNTVLNSQQSLFEATGAFMVATVIALITGWLLEKRLPTMPLISGLFIIIFENATLSDI